jgi:hypothetical protein
MATCTERTASTAQQTQALKAFMKGVYGSKVSVSEDMYEVLGAVALTAMHKLVNGVISEDDIRESKKKTLDTGAMRRIGALNAETFVSCNSRAKAFREIVDAKEVESP